MGQNEIYVLFKNNKNKTYTTKQIANKLNLSYIRACILLSKTVKNYSEIKRQCDLTRNSPYIYYWRER